jgi:CheY-like chemotaxis protein
VSTAASLTQVRQLLREGSTWDLVITDYQLDNEGSGIDVIALIRQHHDKQIPCILISGDIGPAVLKLASVGGHHLLHKPVRPAKLRSLVVYLLEVATSAAT